MAEYEYSVKKPPRRRIKMHPETQMTVPRREHPQERRPVPRREYPQERKPVPRRDHAPMQGSPGTDPNLLPRKNHASMESSPAAAVLHRPAVLRRRLERLLVRRSDCSASCGRVSTRYGSVRVTNGARNTNETAWSALADLNEEIRLCRDAVNTAEQDAETLLRRITDSPGRTSDRDARLLRLHYLENLSWPEIREHLCFYGYPAADRTLLNWHRAALRHADAVFGN